MEQYFNDTQEIDIEFLSREFNAVSKIFPVNLVLQTRESALAGYDARKTGTSLLANLSFDPTADFHEYRIDYLPNRVLFYADGRIVGHMNGSAVPSGPGHLILQHWSNGNPQWSGGPPARDAVLTVRHAMAFFNSSNAPQVEASNARCATGKGDVCHVPDVGGPNETAKEWASKVQGLPPAQDPEKENTAVCTGASQLLRVFASVVPVVVLMIWS